jgi:hypothetical protein
MIAARSRRRAKEDTMPLLHTLWSPVERMPARREPLIDEDEDLVLGWECAVPALQVDAWEPLPSQTMDRPLRAAT